MRKANSEADRAPHQQVAQLLARVLSGSIKRCGQRERLIPGCTSAWNHEHHTRHTLPRFCFTGAASNLDGHTHAKEVSNHREVALERGKQARKELCGVTFAVGAGPWFSARSTQLLHERHVLAAQKALQAREHPVVHLWALHQTHLCNA